jgi:hypothetical protein
MSQRKAEEEEDEEEQRDEPQARDQAQADQAKGLKKLEESTGVEEELASGKSESAHAAVEKLQQEGVTSASSSEQVQVAAEDVRAVASELEMSESNAEKALRSANGSLKQCLSSFVRS